MVGSTILTDSSASAGPSTLVASSTSSDLIASAHTTFSAGQTTLVNLFTSIASTASVDLTASSSPIGSVEFTSTEKVNPTKSTTAASTTSIVKTNISTAKNNSETQYKSSNSASEIGAAHSASYTSTISVEQASPFTATVSVGCSSSTIASADLHTSVESTIITISSRPTVLVHSTTLLTSEINTHSASVNSNSLGHVGTTVIEGSTLSTSLTSTTTAKAQPTTSSVTNGDFEENASAVTSLENASGVSTITESSQYSSIHSTKSFTTTTSNAVVTSQNSLTVMSTNASIPVSYTHLLCLQSPIAFEEENSLHQFWHWRRPDEQT